jgi:hypothetical protein
MYGHILDCFGEILLIAGEKDKILQFAEGMRNNPLRLQPKGRSLKY